MRAGPAALASSILFLPVFFALYRLMAFATVPRDDYAPFLLWLLGAPGGAFPESPYGYRILSVSLAAPFYALPTIPLTNLPPNLSPAYLHATAALAMLSTLSMLLAGWTVWALARRSGLAARDGLLAALLLLALCGFTQYVAIDPLALCWIALCWYALPFPLPFTALVLLAPFVNEKIVIVLCLALTARTLADGGRQLRWQWTASLAAALLYGALLKLVALPGNAYQVQPGAWLATIAGNLRSSLSARGVVLNLLPASVVLALAAAAWRGRRLVPPLCFSGPELLVVPGLALVALTLTETLQIGRVLAHAAPLLVVPAAAWLGPTLDAERRGRHNPALRKS